MCKGKLDRRLPTQALARRRLPLWPFVFAPSMCMAGTDLTDLNLEQLLQMTVVGASKYEQKQSEVAAAVSIITREEIKAFGWHTLADALASLPGLYTTYDRQYNYLGTRGFGVPGDLNTRTLVMVNGNRLNDPTFDSGPVGASLPLDMDLVERIEYIPGPGGAVYGQNAMFGVVNVITRTAASVNGVELAASYQEPQAEGEIRATWGKQLDNGLNMLISMSGMNARGQDLFFNYGASGISGVATGLDGERNRQLFANVTRGPWSFDLMYSNHTKDDPTGAYLSDPLVPGQFQGDGYTVGQLTYQNSFAADALQVSGRLFSGQERYTSMLSYGTRYSSTPAVGDWVGAEVRLLWTGIAGHKLMLGLETQDNTRQDEYIINFANPADNISIPESGHRIGVYVQDEWQLTRSVSSTLGARVDQNNVTGTTVSPRVAFIWEPSPVSTLKALYGRAYRAPNVFERDYSDNVTQTSNPSLQGESIDTLELVADYRASPVLNLRASVYEWTMEHLITLGIDPVTGLSQYQSGETDHARGIELSADRTWEQGARLRGSVSIQNVDRSGGTPLVNSPQVLGKLNFSAPLHWAGLRLSYEAQYDSSRLTLNGTSVGGYMISNVRLSTDALAKGLDVSLGIYNAFDRHYAEPAAYTNWQNVLQQDGRSVQLKLNYAF